MSTLADPMGFAQIDSEFGGYVIGMQGAMKADGLAERDTGIFFAMQDQRRFSSMRKSNRAGFEVLESFQALPGSRTAWFLNEFSGSKYL